MPVNNLSFKKKLHEVFVLTFEYILPKLQKDGKALITLYHLLCVSFR